MRAIRVDRATETGGGGMEDRAILCWLATVSEEGLPNVSPKEVYAEPSEGVFLIAEIASQAAWNEPVTSGSAIESNSSRVGHGAW